MMNKIRQNKLMNTGATFILIGALSVFPENGTWMHTTLQIMFVFGCVLFVYGGYKQKRTKKS